MSMVFSCLIRSVMASITMKQPVRPTPALEIGKENQIVRLFSHITCSVGAVSWCKTGPAELKHTMLCLNQLTIIEIPASNISDKAGKN